MKNETSREYHETPSAEAKIAGYAMAATLAVVTGIEGFKTIERIEEEPGGISWFIEQVGKEIGIMQDVAKEQLAAAVGLREVDTEDDNTARTRDILVQGFETQAAFTEAAARNLDRHAEAIAKTEGLDYTPFMVE